MKPEDLETTINHIKSILPEDVASTIDGDLGTIITMNNKALESIKEKDTQINTLTERNTLLTASNGQLLQQIPRGIPKDDNPKNEDKYSEPFDYHSIFE